MFSVNICLPIIWSPKPNINNLLGCCFFFPAIHEAHQHSDTAGSADSGISENTVTETKLLTWKSVFSFQDHSRTPAEITGINTHQRHVLLERILPWCQTSPALEGSYDLYSSQKARK